MKLFCERLLARLIERHAVSLELARKLLGWRIARRLIDPQAGRGWRRRWRGERYRSAKRERSLVLTGSTS